MKNVHIIVCLDEQKGMMFNRRRQSRDKKVREDMLSLIDGKLWVSPYTARQFASEEQERLEVSEQFLSLAQQGEFCFVEEQDVLPYVEKIEDVIVYLDEKLHRRHPHVFGDHAKAASPEEALALWREMKQKERAGKK